MFHVFAVENFRRCKH